MSTDINPDILAMMREEEQHTAMTRRGDRRVKLEKGKTWKLRFIPAKLGPRKSWYARISKHWVNNKPITCPINTHPDFGGDPEAYCPACETSKTLNDAADETVSKFGFKARASDQWLTYCIVTEIDGNEVDAAELLNPYEFSHYINTWEELKGFFRGSYTKRNPLSILDYRLGHLFSVTRTAKGLRLDKLDQCPIFDDTDPNFDAHIARLEASIKMPKIVIPTQAQLEAFAQKMEDAAYAVPDSEKRGRRAPAVTEDPLEEMDTEPAEEAPAAPVSRRPAPPAAPRPAAAMLRPAPTVARPAPATAPRPAPAPAARPAPAPAAVRPAPRPAAKAPAEDVGVDEPPADDPADEPVLDGDQPPTPPDDSNSELMPEEAPPEPVRRPAARPAPTASRRLPPMPAAAAEAAGVPDEGAEEEQLPEEADDQAPASPVEEDAPEIEPPPLPPAPVARRGSSPLGDAIKSRVAAIKNREGAR